MLISPRHLVDRLRHPRSRADDLAALRARFNAQPGRHEASEEQIQLAERLRALRVALSEALTGARACGTCAAGHPTPHGRWDGGHCCGCRTDNVFTPHEVAALKLAGTRPTRLDPPRSDHAGCAFRGPTGCSLHPEDRPTICVRYVCPTLRMELRDEPRWREIARLRRELTDTFARLEQTLPP